MAFPDGIAMFEFISECQDFFVECSLLWEKTETALLVHASKSFIRLLQMFWAHRMQFISVGLNESEPDIWEHDVPG